VGKAIGRVRLSVRSSVCFRSNFRTSLLSSVKVKDQLFQKSGNRRTRPIALHFHAGGNKNYQKSNTLKLRVKFWGGVREPVSTIRRRLCVLIPGTPVPSNRGSLGPVRSMNTHAQASTPWTRHRQYLVSRGQSILCPRQSLSSFCCRMLNGVAVNLIGGMNTARCFD